MTSLLTWLAWFPAMLAMWATWCGYLQNAVLHTGGVGTVGKVYICKNYESTYFY